MIMQWVMLIILPNLQLHRIINEYMDLILEFTLD